MCGGVHKSPSIITRPSFHLLWLWSIFRNWMKMECVWEIHLRHLNDQIIFLISHFIGGSHCTWSDLPSFLVSWLWWSDCYMLRPSSTVLCVCGEGRHTVFSKRRWSPEEEMIMRTVNLNQMTRIAQQKGRGRVPQAQRFEMQGLVVPCGCRVDCFVCAFVGRQSQ